MPCESCVSDEAPKDPLQRKQKDHEEEEEEEEQEEKKVE